MADALHHAHGLKDDLSRPLHIVHRDVSPRNIRVGVHGEVKLTNFTAAASTLPGREVTSRPLIKGDVAYASPEALRREPVDARSDLFSLGLVLLELLAGRHPLMGDDTVPPLRTEVRGDARPLQAQGPTWMPLDELAARMVRLGSEQVAGMLADMPEALVPLVVRALRQEPAERFQTGAELSAALRGWLRAHAPGYGRHEAAEELTRVATEATGRRNQAELLEGGLHPEGLTAEEAAMELEPEAPTQPAPEATGSSQAPVPDEARVSPEAHVPPHATAPAEPEDSEREDSEPKGSES